MSALFVTGAGTDIGKTYVSCALLKAWRFDSYSCAAFKPVVTGFDEEAPEGSDPALLIEAVGRTATPDLINRISPLRFKAPLAPPSAARLERKQITALSLQMLCQEQIGRAGRTNLLIEGAGGVMSPIADDATVLDLIQRLDIPVVFVGGTYLGAVSHTLSGLEALASRGASVAAVVISESKESVGLVDTCDMVKQHGRVPRVWAAPRDQHGWAAPLARALSARDG